MRRSARTIQRVEEESHTPQPCSPREGGLVERDAPRGGCAAFEPGATSIGTPRQEHMHRRRWDEVIQRECTEACAEQREKSRGLAYPHERPRVVEQQRIKLRPKGPPASLETPPGPGAFHAPPIRK